MLQNALFDFLQIVVILVQNLARARDVEFAFDAGLPRQFAQQLQVRAYDVIIRSRRRQSFQPVQLPPGLLLRFLGQAGLFQTFAQQIDFGLFRAALAEFLLNGAQLLAQEILALLLAHLVLHVASDLAAQFEHLHFVAQIGVHQAQRIGACLRFQ